MAAQPEWYEKDYYKVLGVAKSASDKEITRAYRKLAKQYHPDANPGAEERFKEISAAYDVLGDPGRRKEYDSVRRLGPMGGTFGGGGGAAGPGGFKVDDLSDLLGGIFNKGPRGTARRTPAPETGMDLEADLHLDFMDAVQGITTTVHITSDAHCSVCAGSGSAPGTSPVICPTCHGRGALDENQGLFSFSQPCRTCGGSGMRIEKPCGNCSGSGVERRPRQVKVRIPPGVHDGQRIRLKGRGGAGHQGGQPGDLYVTVRVGGHQLFERRGNDLQLTVPITFAEAALGATVKVPTLTTPVSLKIPPGTRSGKRFRVKGRGIGANGSTGDLLVTAEVVVPDKLSDSERKAVEAFAKASKDSPRKHLGV